MGHYVFLYCRPTSNIFPPICVVACNIYRGSLRILFFNWLTATVSILPLNSHKTAKPTDSRAPSTHIPQLFPFRIQCGVCPISSYCITARTSQFGLGTRHHKQTPPIRNEVYTLLPNQRPEPCSWSCNRQSSIIGRKQKSPIKICCDKSSSVSSCYTSRHRQCQEIKWTDILTDTFCSWIAH